MQSSTDSFFWLAIGMSIIVLASWFYRLMALVQLPYYYCRLNSKHPGIMSKMYTHNRKRRIELAKVEDELWKKAKALQEVIDGSNNDSAGIDVQKIQGDALVFLTKTRAGRKEAPLPRDLDKVQLLQAIKEEIKIVNKNYGDMLEYDKNLDEKVDEMTKSEEYQSYQRFLSEDYFNWSEDFFTLGLYEMGTASQNVDEHYVEKNAYAQFLRFKRRLLYDTLP